MSFWYLEHCKVNMYADDTAIYNLFLCQTIFVISSHICSQICEYLVIG